MADEWHRPEFFVIDRRINSILALTSRISGDNAQNTEILWYHCVALFNCYYAIMEQIIKVIANDKNDAHIKSVVDSWSKNWVGHFLEFRSNRNTVTHQGRIDVKTRLEWDDDFWHETQFPVRRAYVTFASGGEYEDVPADEAIQYFRKHFEDLRWAIADLNFRYGQASGVVKSVV